MSDHRDWRSDFSGQADLAEACQTRHFAAGEVLRTQGSHYRDMFILIDGEVRVDIPGRPDAEIRRTSGPIGEISFLRGTPATAQVTAVTPATALVMDDDTLTEIKRAKPAVAVQLMQLLATYARDRTSFNLALNSDAGSDRGNQPIEVRLCRDGDMLAEAQCLRYLIYCEELGRSSPNADHDRKILRDELDDFGHVFITVQNGETIGTMRTNFASQGDLGILPDLYGMKQSIHYPDHSALNTKFMVKRSHRKSTAALTMMANMARFGRKNNISETYIDCVPQLVHYYTAMGFRISAEQYLHEENGPSYPMRLDIDKYYKRVSADPTRWQMFKIYSLAKLSKFLSRFESPARHSNRSRS